MFEHDESLRADLLPINFPASYENGKLEYFLHRWMKNHEHKNFWFSMFPERRYFFSIRETRSTTEVTLVDRYVVCEKHTHAMTLVDPYVVYEKNTHAMTLVDPCGL